MGDLNEPDAVAGVLSKLAQVAALVRENAPSKFECNVRFRSIEMPPEHGWVVHENGGLESVSIEIVW